MVFEGYKRLPASQHVHSVCNLEVCSDHLRFSIDVVIRCFPGVLAVMFSCSRRLCYWSLFIAYRFLVLSDGTKASWDFRIFNELLLVGILSIHSMCFQEYGKSNFRSVAMSVLVPFLFRSCSVLLPFSL